MGLVTHSRMIIDGQEFPAGTPIETIRESVDYPDAWWRSVIAARFSEAEDAPAGEAPANEPPAPSPAPAPTATTALEVNATEAAIRIAAEHGLDLSEIHGHGQDGRVTADDVRAAVEDIVRSDNDDEDG